MKLFRLLFFVGLFFILQPLFAQAPKVLPAFSFDEVYQAGRFSSDKLPKAGYIVLDFYDPGCGHCQKMGAGIAQNLPRFKNVHFYFISMNDKPYVDGFINMHAKPLRNAQNVKFLFDPGTQFIEKFNPTNYPSLYVYDAKTKTLLQHLDGEDDVKKLLKSVNGID
ncbi:redoxin domain-containing protein [Sphingobacterium sp. InxBP1]|uniref:TlpA family protein disulfide reductase n=1 Tax=Sphingobacterium sp. InxBP1 TaxID=2870328 RepID=UPI0022449BFC|nr:redoxin domain-containing protein [Sphingobacterium sp. InxBP1]MCW8313315.1 redoxin domain-containing protein [Sphingobacterium sp. InxBP1]